MATNIQKQLIEYVRYFDHNRGVGHTDAMINGVKNNDNAIVMCNTMKGSEYIKSQVTCAVMSRQDIYKLKGHRISRSPMVFDNYALSEIFRDSLYEMDTMAKKIHELETKLKKIKEITNADV